MKAVAQNNQLVICRCEEVTLDQIEEAKASGAQSVNDVKLQTRAGMGTCQGRTCLRVLALLCPSGLEGEGATTTRWPVRPVRFESLARSLPEPTTLQIPLMELDLPEKGGES